MGTGRDGSRHERYEGVDAGFLDSDTWAEEEGRPCPKCGYEAGPDQTRCLRCGALLLAGCSGSCASCGARACARREPRTESRR